MSDELDWSWLEAYVMAGPKAPADRFMTRFREAAYRGEAPWRDKAVRLSPRTRQALLADMARHAASLDELAATFRALDDAVLSRGQAWITSEAGDVLMRRARKGQLPAGWPDRIVGAVAGADRPSGHYWAGAVLRAAGHKVAEPRPEPAAPEGAGLA
jgi:hypothetical protein